MKILLVNNDTLHLPKLMRDLSGHQVEIQAYRPGIDFHLEGKDLVILSGGGGEGKEFHNYHKLNRLWYEDEMELVLASQKPIIGICMGFEVIAAAYGSAVSSMPRGIERFADFKATDLGQKRLGASTLWQYEAHDWRIEDVSSRHFEVLAESETGLEIIKHQSAPIIATQFHPEVSGGFLSLKKLIELV